MSLTEINQLFAYQWSTANNLLATAAKLTPEQYHENPGYGHGSVHDLFIHSLGALSGWRNSLETGKFQFTFDPSTCPNLPEVTERFAQEAANWQRYLDQITPEQYSSQVKLSNSRGDKLPFILWHILHHLNLHSMQHHTEIAQLLTAQSHSPGDLDLIFYFYPIE